MQTSMHHKKKGAIFRKWQRNLNQRQINIKENTFKETYVKRSRIKEIVNASPQELGNKITNLMGNTNKFSFLSVDGENQIEETKIQNEQEQLLFRFKTEKNLM